MSEEKEFFTKDFTIEAQTSTEDVPVDENFDWNDERRKKYEKRQEYHAQYFSPLSVISELIAESNEDEGRKARDKEEWDTFLKKERKLISERKEKERQENIQRNELKAYYKTCKVVDRMKERLRNQETIESFQEDIIESEEYVPAYKNMPKEKYLNTEKTRRIQKQTNTGQTTVHCPFCNNKRRTLDDLIKHMHQIHSREMREKASEQSQTEKGEIKEVKVDFQTKLEEEEDFHIYLKLSNVQESTPDHKKTSTSGSNKEKLIFEEGIEDEVDIVSNLTEILCSKVNEKVNKTSNVDMGQMLLQQEELQPEPATIASTAIETLDRLSQAGNTEEGQLLAQQRMLQQATQEEKELDESLKEKQGRKEEKPLSNYKEICCPILRQQEQHLSQIATIAPKPMKKTYGLSQAENSELSPQLVNSLRQEEKKVYDQNLKFDAFNENNTTRNIGQRGWLHKMASKVNLTVFLYRIHPILIEFFSLDNSEVTQDKRRSTKKEPQEKNC